MSLPATPSTDPFQGRFYGRSFRLLVGGLKIESISRGAEIQPALRVVFDVKRDKTRDPDEAVFSIFNLGPESRAQLESQANLSLVFEAGYQSNLQQVFAGVVRRAISSKPDHTWITTLGCGDAGAGKLTTQPTVTAPQLAKAWPKGTTIAAVFSDLCKAAGIAPGNVSDVTNVARMAGQGTLPRALHKSGVALRLLYDMSRTFGFGVTIQNGAARFFPDGSGTGAGILLTPESGLLGVPKVDSKGVITARALLLPDLLPASMVRIQSKTVRGDYAVRSTRHSGDSIGDDWVVEFTAAPPPATKR